MKISVAVGKCRDVFPPEGSCNELSSGRALYTMMEWGKEETEEGDEYG